MIDCNEDSLETALNLSKKTAASSEKHEIDVVWNLSVKNQGSQYSLPKNINRDSIAAVDSPDSTTIEDAEHVSNYVTTSPVRCKYENEDWNLDSLNSLWLPHFQTDLPSPTSRETTNQLSSVALYSIQKKCNLADREKDLPVTPRKRRKQVKPVRVINRTYVTSTSDIHVPSSSQSSSPLQEVSTSNRASISADQDASSLFALESKSPTSPWDSSPSVTCPYCNTAVQLTNFAHHLQTHLDPQIGAPSPGTETYPPSNTGTPGSLTLGIPLPEIQEQGFCRIINYEAYCKICDKEFCNKFFLRKHKAKQHGIFDNGLTFPSFTSALDLSKSCVSYFKATIPPPTAPMPSLDTDLPEGKQNAKTRVSFGQVKTEVNANDGNWTTDDVQSPPKHVRNYCKICDKELCNKYFLKRHMLKMHSIDLGNKPNIGGVICDVCYKELCSKYFLKVHKQNAHGIGEELKFEAQVVNNTKSPFL